MSVGKLFDDRPTTVNVLGRDGTTFAYPRSTERKTFEKQEGMVAAAVLRIHLVFFLQKREAHSKNGATKYVYPGTQP